MKKTLFIIIGTFLLIMLILALTLIGIQSRNRALSDINSEYEFYLNKEIYGTELAALINKAIDNNEKAEVEKDINGYYINNGQDSILITIQMIGTNEKFQMERVFALGTEQFVELFNSGIFISEKATYHEQTGRIATIDFKQIQE